MLTSNSKLYPRTRRITSTTIPLVTNTRELPPNHSRGENGTPDILVGFTEHPKNNKIYVGNLKIIILPISIPEHPTVPIF